MILATGVVAARPASWPDTRGLQRGCRVWSAVATTYRQDREDVCLRAWKHSVQRREGHVRPGPGDRSGGLLHHRRSPSGPSGTSSPRGFGPEPVSHHSALKNSRAIILVNIDEFDVFGDGTVVIKRAPGHTPGHQVLIVKLPKTGPVMLAGDLYHFPEERPAQLVPRIEFDKEQSRTSRVAIEA